MRLFALLFTLSGFSALAYQVVWQRVLTQLIGSDSISMVLIVSIFMIWLGVGAEMARRLLPRINFHPGVFYAAIELVVGVAGLVSIPVMRSANGWLATYGESSVYNDVFLNLLLLAIPVIGMGMTTPLIIEVAKTKLSDLGKTVGKFYGLNILGAAIGALLTGLVLIELLGLFGVTCLAALINLFIGLAILFVMRKQVFGISSPVKSGSTMEKPQFVERLRFDRMPWPYLLGAVLFGFGTLALQVVYFRVLSNYFTLSVVVFPCVLCAYLLLMSAGQLVGGRLADRYSDRLNILILILFSVGAILLLASLRFPPAWAAHLGLLTFTSFNGQLISDLYPELIGDPQPVTVLLFSLVFMLSVLAWAALFPVMVKLITKDIRQAGGSFAGLYTLYTLGNVAGTLVTGLYFFDWFGTGGTAAVSIVIVGLGAMAIYLRRQTQHGSKLAVIAALAALLAVLIMPFDYYKTFRVGRYQIADVFEGRTGVASVVPTGRFYTIVDINRTASASALVKDPGPKDQYEAWRWNHTELFALDPGFRPKNILIIGIGHAYLIDALLDLQFVEKITIVDLSKEVVDAVRKHTRTSTARIFSDPRVEIIIADGRRFVQQALAKDTKYDLIQTKINEPWHAGSGNLFTIEFFRAQKQLLNPGGYLGVRPLIGHVVDGMQVFGKALWPGYYHLFFKNGDLKLPQEARVKSDIKEAWYRYLPGKTDSKTDREGHLKVALFECCEFGKNIRLNTDDLPSFEYYWLARQLGYWKTPRTSLWYMDIPMKKIPVQIDP